MTKIIDVSEFNGAVDFAKVKADGISGVIIRCGLTGNGTAKSKYTDKMFEANYAAACAAGLPVGVYYYSCATTEGEAVAEAEKVIGLLAGKTLQLPVYWDTEDNHNVAAAGASPQNQRTIGKAQLTACANAFLDAIHLAGYQSGIYGSTSWLANQLDMHSVKADSVWVAQYYKECQYNTTAYDMWQYTSSGTVDGVNGRVDISECYADYAVKPAPEKKSVDTLAGEVLAGKWGNGAERKEKLEAAGYDYTAVQSAVNTALGATPAPTDPVQKKSVSEIAQEVLAGKWGNGGDRTARLTVAGYNPAEVQNAVNAALSTPKPAPAKSVEEVAHEVMRGAWGNGGARRANLESAGYNYKEVQAAVNKLLK